MFDRVGRPFDSGVIIGVICQWLLSCFGLVSCYSFQISHLSLSIINGRAGNYNLTALWCIKLTATAMLFSKKKG